MTVTLMRADSGVVVTTKNASKPNPRCDEKEPPMIHPLVHDVKKQVDDYVSQNWDFSNEDAKKEFVDRNISSVASYYLPSGLDDRIFLVSRLLATLYLIAGEISRYRPTEIFDR